MEKGEGITGIGEQVGGKSLIMRQGSTFKITSTLGRTWKDPNIIGCRHARISNPAFVISAPPCTFNQPSGHLGNLGKSMSDLCFYKGLGPNLMRVQKCLELEP